MTNEELLQSISEIMDKKLQNFATKEDLKEFAIKEDLKEFATKEDLRTLENNILEEVDTVQEKANDHFALINKHLDNIEKEVNASKLQNDTLSLLIRRIDKMQDEIDELKKKIS